MLLFMAAYIGQWWAYGIYSFWRIFEQPHAVIMLASVLFGNLGGTFNFIVYIVIKQRLSKTSSRVENDGTTRVTSI